MARSVFFSFHYQNDVWRANQIRNLHIVEGTAAAGFLDSALWEEARRRGDAAIKALIDKGLQGTTVTVVLIGSETANRTYVQYEITQSIARNNGLIGIYVDGLQDQNQRTSRRGSVPGGLLGVSAPVYEWNHLKFGDWVETAAKKAGH